MVKGDDAVMLLAQAEKLFLEEAEDAARDGDFDLKRACLRDAEAVGRLIGRISDGDEPGIDFDNTEGT